MPPLPGSTSPSLRNGSSAVSTVRRGRKISCYAGAEFFRSPLRFAAVQTARDAALGNRNALARRDSLRIWDRRSVSNRCWHTTRLHGGRMISLDSSSCSIEPSKLSICCHGWLACPEERVVLPMMNGERKRTSLKVVIAKIDDAIQELRGLDYVGDKWALIADLLRVRNDVNTELEVTP